MTVISNIRNRIRVLIPQHSLRFRFAKGVFWSFAGMAAFQFLAFAAYVIVARLLGKVVYGEFGMIRNTAGMFGVFAGMGLSLTATKHVAEYRLKDPARAGRIIGMASVVASCTGAVMGIILFAIAPYLSTHVINAPHLVFDLRLSSGLLFLGALNGAQLGTLYGFEAFRAIAAVNLVRGISSFAAVPLAAYLWKLHGAVGAMLITMALTCLASNSALRRMAKKAGISVTFRHVVSELSVFWSFSLPAFLGSTLVGPVRWGAAALLANQPKGYAQLGIFTAAQAVAMVVRMLSDLTSKVSLPILSQLYGKADKTAYKQVLWKLLKLYAAGCVVVMVPLCLLSPFVMSIYGSGFEEGWLVLCILAASTAIWIVNTIAGQAIASSGKMWWGLMINALWGVSVLICSYLMVPGMGALGLALAFLISYVLHSVWTGIYIYFAIVRRL